MLPNLLKNSIIYLTGFICLVLILSFTVCNKSEKNEKEILTLGTIHNFHANSAYSYSDIVDVLDTYKPDLICVEIRPQIFRNEIYLTEMMIATAYGDMNNIPVIPIDWYDEKNNDREIRDSLSRTDKYLRLEKISDSLMRNSEILKAFSKKYGENVYRNNSLDIDFWNGTDYSNSVRESYRISLETFGDSPYNLHYITRNRNMLHYIKKGIQKYNAGKIIILTGAEHKSFFDDSLKKDFKVKSLENILPLKKVDFASFLREMRPGVYFTTSDSSKADDYYKGLTLPYFHGMGMDLDISNINLINLPQTKIILKNWETDVPNSVMLLYDLAWYSFLNREYDKSINYANKYLAGNKLETTPFKDWAAFRIIAFCYDLQNKHNEAIPYYKKARESMSRTMQPKVIDLFLKDYENNPYVR